MGKPEWKLEILMKGSWRGASSVLLTDGRHHIVVDTGMPHEGQQLIQALETHGLHPEDIQFLINTHFHVDHVMNNFLFPNSVIYGVQQSYDWCRAVYSDLLDGQNWEKLVLKYYPETHDYERSKDLMSTLRKFALRWWDPQRLGDLSRFRWIETQPLPDGLESFVTSGHVPGHASIIVHNSGPNIVIAGDALLTREQHEQVLTMIPCNREQFLKDRQSILALNGLIVPGHDQEFSTQETQEADPADA